jgi:hypothetical protein
MGERIGVAEPAAAMMRNRDRFSPQYSTARRCWGLRVARWGAVIERRRIE